LSPYTTLFRSLALGEQPRGRMVEHGPQPAADQHVPAAGVLVEDERPWLAPPVAAAAEQERHDQHTGEHDDGDADATCDADRGPAKRSVLRVGVGAQDGGKKPSGSELVRVYLLTPVVHGHLPFCI